MATKDEHRKIGRLAGTTWDIKKPKINSPYRELKYAEQSNDIYRIKFWKKNIQVKKIMRRFLDKEWDKKYLLVKNYQDWIILVQNPAEKKIEQYFNTNIKDLHTGKYVSQFISAHSGV